MPKINPNMAVIKINANGLLINQKDKILTLDKK